MPIEGPTEGPTDGPRDGPRDAASEPDRADAERAAVVGRLAPSPTGLLHVGHARSFVAAWLSARARGGRVVLRIEDLDGDRARPEFSDAILTDLEWIGLDWDGAPRLQSEGRARIEAAARRLEASAAAYACTCSRADVRRALEAPHEHPGGIPGAESEPVYPGTCRGRYASRAAAAARSGRDAALRFKAPEETLRLRDRVRGSVAFDAARELGDFVVARRDGWPSYQLAVVVDDATDGVTEVVRGDDLLPSAGRQRLLQRALDLPRPSYAHLPLVVDDAGRRLAKRDGALALAALRAEGVDPRALVGWVAASLGVAAEARTTPSELVRSLGSPLSDTGSELADPLRLAPLAAPVFGERQRRALRDR